MSNHPPVHKPIQWSDKFLSATFLKLFPKFILPNHLTILRFMMIPFVVFFVYTESYVVGITLFAVAAFTDALDGALARTTDQVTWWGKIYDPVADKILIGSTALILLPRFLNIWLALIIIGAELLILAGALYMKRQKPTKQLSANMWGKTKMVLQSFALVVLLLHALYHIPDLVTIAADMFYASIIFAVVSLITYGL